MRVPVWLPFALLVAGLMLLTIRPLGDLDFGFYVASGRQFLEAGIPPSEFLAPLLSRTTLSSQWIVSAMIFAGMWDLAGPSAIVLLCAITYAGGFVLAALGAVRQGASKEAACFAAGVAATIVAVRLVERPGCFSVLFLGAVIFLLLGAKGPIGIGTRIRLVALFVLWPWFHAEWLVGLGVASLLLLASEGPRWRASATILAMSVLPTVVFAALHPGGAKVLFQPLSFLFGNSTDFGVREYTGLVYTVHPLLSLAFLVGAAAVYLSLRARQWHQATALGVLLALAIAIPRAHLPLVVLAIPTLAVAITPAFLLPRRALLLLSLMVVGCGWAGERRPGPWLRLGIDDRLDARSIGEVLDRVPKREGYILSEFGMSSMLLAQDSVVRQGIVMDGRQEAYPKDYFENVYVPALGGRLPGDQDPRIWYASHGIAFYFEQWEGIGPKNRRLYTRFHQMGWRCIAWDNTGYLMAAPHVIERHGLVVVDPPGNLPVPEKVLRDPAALASLLRAQQLHVDALESRGLPVPRPLLSLARLQIAAGDLAAAEATLERARLAGATRYATFLGVEQTIEALRP